MSEMKREIKEQQETYFILNLFSIFFKLSYKLFFILNLSLFDASWRCVTSIAMTCFLFWNEEWEAVVAKHSTDLGFNSLFTIEPFG